MITLLVSIIEALIIWVLLIKGILYGIYFILGGGENKNEWTRTNFTNGN